MALGLGIALALYLYYKKTQGADFQSGKYKDPDVIEPSFAKKSNFHLIPDGLGNYRSEQLSLNDLERVIKDYGIKNIIRMNGDGTDTWNGVKRSEEQALCKRLGCNYYFIDAHSGYQYGKGYVKSMEKAHPIMAQGNTLVHCNHGADRTGYIVASFLKNKGYMTDLTKLWNYTIKYNGWQKKISRKKFYGTGFDKYADGFYPLDKLKQVYKP